MDAVTIGVTISPLDPLFFRDGRPFDAASQVRTGLPQPQTFSGAMRTAILSRCGTFDFGRFLSRRRGKLRRSESRDDFFNMLADCGAPAWQHHLVYRGPWLALRFEEADDGDQIVPLIPVPANLRRAHDATWEQLAPRLNGAPGWQPPKETPSMCPLWFTSRDVDTRSKLEDADRPQGFLTTRGISRFLNGGVPAESEWFEAEDLYGFDPRIGIGIDADSLTCARSQLYGIRFLSLKSQVAARRRIQKLGENDEYAEAEILLYGEIVATPSDVDSVADHVEGLMPFGGEGKYVEVSRTATLAQWPTGQARGPYRRKFLLLATPGLFQVRDDKPAWIPDSLPPSDILGAACDGGVAVSGWDGPANGPKPTRFAVPAGGVYFVESLDESFPESLCSDPFDVADGWGFALRGVW